MTAPTITPLPPAPVRSDAPADFAAKADAFAAALPRLVTEANAQADFTDQRAAAAESGAATATSKAAEAANAAATASTAAATATSKATEAVGAASTASSSAETATAAATSATQDAQAVAASLASIAGGPVASVAGKTGVVTTEQLESALRAMQHATALLF